MQGKRKARLCDNEKRHFTDEDEWIICENSHEPIISREILYIYEGLKLLQKIVERLMLMKQINNGYADYYYLLEDGSLYNAAAD